MASDRHVRSLKASPFWKETAHGTVQRVVKDDFPLLDRLSLKRVVLAPGGVREPHWHANAHELSYCLAGSLIVTVVDNKDVVSRFTVEAGEMFFAPSGSLHAFENAGEGEAEVLVAFSHASPSDFSLHATFGAMSDAVLGNSFGLPAAQFAGLTRDTSSPYVVGATSGPTRDATTFATPYRFALAAQQPPVTSPSGTARVARSQFWPILKDIAMYRIDVPDAGMREVHWHPGTAEMGYVQKGRARMTILDPDGTTDTYLLGPGDVYFVPRAYPHQIEVLGEDITFLIFFDQPMPGDIGLKLCGAAVSRPLMVATFGVAEEALPPFPPIADDPLIVAKVNPTDPA